MDGTLHPAEAGRALQCGGEISSTPLLMIAEKAVTVPLSAVVLHLDDIRVSTTQPAEASSFWAPS